MDKSGGDSGRYIKAVGIGTLVFALLLTALLFGFAAVLTNYDINATAITVVSILISCVAALVGGAVSARIFDKNGLMLGFICGVFSFLLLFILSLIFGDGSLTSITLVRFIAMAICASAGGVVGVNVRAKHKI